MVTRKPTPSGVGVAGGGGVAGVAPWISRTTDLMREARWDLVLIVVESWVRRLVGSPLIWFRSVMRSSLRVLSSSSHSGGSLSSVAQGGSCRSPDTWGIITVG